LLEGKATLLQLRQEIPLRGTEVVAVDEGISAMASLGKLADVLTPAGPTPHEIRARSTGTDDGER
jgi:hypothetical protein